MNDKRYNRTLALVCLLVIAIVLVVLLNLNYPAGKELVISTDLTTDTRTVTRLGPSVRVVKHNEGLAVIESPVYLDMRILPGYNQAKFFVTYKSVDNNFKEMGIQTGPGFQYKTQKPLTITDLQDGWKQAVFDWEFSSAYDEKNVIRFVLSTTGSSSQQPLIIKELKAVLRR